MDGLSIPDITASETRVSQEQAVRKKQALINPQTPRTDEQIDAVAKDFEAVFISEMMKPMFEGVKTSAPFGGGKGEEVFRSMMIQEYGKMLAETGQIGLADHVKDMLLDIQEAQSHGGAEYATSDTAR